MLYFSEASSSKGAGVGVLSVLAAAANNNGGVALWFTAAVGIAIAAGIFYTNRERIKSPWSRRRRKIPLTLQQWSSLFTPEGRLHDGGVELLKIVRSGGVDLAIRAEVWPFLHGVYDLNSSKEERKIVRKQKRKEYEKIRTQCQQALMTEKEGQLNEESLSLIQDMDSSSSEDIISAHESLPSEVRSSGVYSENPFAVLLDNDGGPMRIINADESVLNSESSDSGCSEDSGVINPDSAMQEVEKLSPSIETHSKSLTTEDFVTWRRIIRLDAVRANADWISYSPSQAKVSNDKANRAAQSVGLKDYDHLEPYRIFHAARLVSILEAYAIYDPEIGYCQGMSDLLSPIITFILEDHEAFWCFVGFMRKARHNFRLDEIGIRRQLNIVANIIKRKDSHLYRHLEKLQAADCFFVYRMVVVLFRRELTFEQTVCLWEVMWADQAAIRAGIGKSAWSKIRQQAPPTEDLLLYAIAASVLQRRKLIIERYSGMDEIIKECNSMAGQLDVWKLLDDAHNLVVSLHDKVETPF